MKSHKNTGIYTVRLKILLNPPAGALGAAIRSMGVNPSQEEVTALIQELGSPAGVDEQTFIVRISLWRAAWRGSGITLGLYRCVSLVIMKV